MQLSAMIRIRRTVAGVFCAVGFLVLSPSARADLLAHLTLQSQPGDFIGQGGTFDITYPSTEISAQIRATVAGGLPGEILFNLGHVSPAPNTFALLFFGTNQLGIEIQPGIYTNAERADFASPGHPGLDVSFQNRGSNTLTGQFTVTDATFYQSNQAIASFSASFEQHSEGATPALFGTFTFTDTAASNTPEPATSVLFCAGGLLLLLRRVSLRHPAAN
jgi:hypothetical protein